MTNHSDHPNPTLTAFRIERADGLYPRLVPASPDRFWMDFTTQGWANRCLPLRIANQCGWFIMNEDEFEVEWSGKPQLDAVKIRPTGPRPVTHVSSMFGFGTITWSIPYLFRTSPGFNLLARGPANFFKDGIVPLDGMVETDWLPYPFTMNWKITRPGQKIKFDREDPICMMMPLRRGDVEAFAPEIRNLHSEPALEASYEAWHQRRKEIAKAAQGLSMKEAGNLMQGNYIRGETELGAHAREHQNKLQVKPFADREEAPPAKPSEAAPEIVDSKKGLFGRILGR